MKTVVNAGPVGVMVMLMRRLGSIMNEEAVARKMKGSNFQSNRSGKFCT